jgi:hypothetical protein
VIARGKEVPQAVIDTARAAMAARAEFCPDDIRNAIHEAWAAHLPVADRENTIRTASRNLIDMESRAGRIEPVGRGIYRRIAE